MYIRYTAERVYVFLLWLHLVHRAKLKRCSIWGVETGLGSASVAHICKVTSRHHMIPRGGRKTATYIGRLRLRSYAKALAHVRSFQWNLGRNTWVPPQAHRIIVPLLTSS